MDMRGVLIVAIVLCTLSLYPYEVKAQSMELSREEELEIENQLERLNKSSIKIIKTQSGDIYDCVNFYEQPAFDHPLLKNHKYDFQMRPSSRPKGAMNENKPTNKERHVSIKSQFKSKRCPTGTVPIRRMTKEDLIKAKLLTKAHSSRISSLTSKNAGVHQSIVHTKPDPKKKYNGGGTTASFFTLDNVSGSQYSKGQMKIQNGNDFIQVGWTVNPTLYGDHNTRLFTFFKAGEVSCFNTLCPGFVIVSTEIPLDQVLPESHPGGNSSQVVNFFVYKTEEDATNTLKYSVDVDFYEVEHWGFRSELQHIMTYGGPGPK
ncbi:hypothetical protein F8388_023840 [Cannabis sativa]|uniref:Neprosin PEP catalytic domain-containing protein n=1 Tax=Cannabis sativa TaxID=3483 RepID=A0A7J6GA36_CANSA|nr:hypothetical protein F8388_023840 [Cannabis sativa]